MADNRLFIVDQTANADGSHNAIMIAKSLGSSWYINRSDLVEALSSFFAEVDLNAAYGDRPTTLKLMDEDALTEAGMYDKLNRLWNPNKEQYTKEYPYTPSEVVAEQVDVYDLLAKKLGLIEREGNRYSDAHGNHYILTRLGFTRV